MTELIPFTVDGPVKFFKILTYEEKIKLMKHGMIEPKELSSRVMAYYNEHKQVIGYDIDDNSLQ